MRNACLDICRTSTPPQSRGEERGAILILLVLLSVSLLVIASLAVDTGLLSVSRTQHRQTAELLALRSLREYLSATGTPVSRLMTAREKAQQLLGIDVFLGQSFRSNPALDDVIGPMDASLTDGPSGSIIPGIWHYRPELDSNGKCVGASPCPCSPGGDFAGACFEPIDFNNVASFDINGNLARDINAFRAEFRLRGDSPLKPVLAGAGGGNATYTFESNATAAVFPSHGVFLLPLTRYSTMETHQPYERSGWTAVSSSSSINPSESAYHIINSGFSCPSDRTNPCSLAPTNLACTFEGGLFPDLYTHEYKYRQLPNPPLLPNARAAADPATKRAKNDYKCYNVSYTENGAARTESYLVDSYRGPVSNGASTYDGPEPLTSYLSALNYALTLVYNRNIPGDRIGMIAFDQATDVDKRRFIPDFPGGANFNKLLRVTDVTLTDQDSDHNSMVDTAANRLIERVEEALLFVRADGQANIPAALDQARLMLINDTPDPAIAENFVALLGNGVTNCLSDGTCGRDQNTFVVPSIDNAVNYVQGQYVPANIKFHMIAAGDVMQPHTMLRRGGTAATGNSCMTEEETAELGLSYVDSGPAPALNPDLLGLAIKNQPVVPKNPNAPYFYYPNRLQEAVRAAGGIWEPLKDPCSSSALPMPGSMTCGQGGLKVALDTRCAAEASLGKIAENIPGLSDGSGRLYCDIYCRTRRQQAYEAIDKIFSRSPFVLVE